ncbi:hypothetical protein CFO_g2877 [Ceratocystis platani]|uniref:Uncharacterized protein n=1 Tax=Ceratocystis fimbriata f. sp. platani TaxID=88771 RepID=A0A0F8B3R2_CERFI|nr:hypothetical protein CFO_g2877 [Ceratocystis platani]
MSDRPNPPSSPDGFESFREEVANHTGVSQAWVKRLGWVKHFGSRDLIVISDAAMWIKSKVLEAQKLLCLLLGQDWDMFRATFPLREIHDDLLIRNIFVYDGMVMVVTDRDKMKAIHDNGKKVARFAPENIGQMLVAYITWLIPAERSLQQRCDLGTEDEDVAWGVSRYASVFRMTVTLLDAGALLTATSLAPHRRSHTDEMSARPNPPSSPDSFESFREEVANHPGDWFEYLRSLFAYADKKEAENTTLNHTMTTESANYTAIRDSLTANLQATRGQLDSPYHPLLFLLPPLSQKEKLLPLFL